MSAFFDLTIPEEITTFLESAKVYWKPVLKSIVILVVGLILARVLAGVLVSPWRSRMTAQARLVIRKTITYLTGLLIIVMILAEFGVNLTTLLGAAGIAGIAIGFAAQASLSNFISGIFLIWEKPFQVGDVIRVGTQAGVVDSIDLLSLTLRTFDNLAVRIPNETIVKSEVVNVTRFPIRRYDIQLGVGYDENPDHVIAVLRKLADDNKTVLQEPEPLVAFTGFGESQLDFTLGVWHEREDFLELRNSILSDIKERFAEEGIEIPFPHRVVVQQSPTGIESIATASE
ncbi:MAG: small-conductance mechanosensitive channel [Verrucomicrobiales bacterium]|jgi:small-conductance mechanosensitive channel